MVDRRKVFRPISSLDHCQRSSPSRISNTPRAGFEPAQNLISSFVEWFCECKVSVKQKIWPLPTESLKYVADSFQWVVNSEDLLDWISSERLVYVYVVSRGL